MKARLTTMALALALTMFASADALAAPPWVDRRDTLFAGWWAFDFGLGIGHDPGPPDRAAPGINMEMAVGLTDRVELGVRTGLRIGDDVDRAIEPDNYGRLFDRQYFDGGGSVVANPEVRVRGAVVRGDVAELALEGRFIVPVDPNTVAGAEFGMPLALHLGDRVRMDTGFWLPTTFNNPGPILGISVPLDVWIQITPRLWLGPMTGLYWPDVSHNPPANQPAVSMGFGLGYSITHYLDFKTMFLFPEINEDSRVFGLGAGVQIRIE
jgi:hypothetical protein